MAVLFRDLLSLVLLSCGRRTLEHIQEMLKRNWKWSPWLRLTANWTSDIGLNGRRYLAPTSPSVPLLWHAFVLGDSPPHTHTCDTSFSKVFSSKTIPGLSLLNGREGQEQLARSRTGRGWSPRETRSGRAMLASRDASAGCRTFLSTIASLAFQAPSALYIAVRVRVTLF